MKRDVTNTGNRFWLTWLHGDGRNENDKLRQHTIVNAKPNVDFSRPITRSSTYRGRNTNIHCGRDRIPFQSAVVFELSVEHLGVAHEHAEWRRVVDRDDVWQGPCAASGCFDLQRYTVFRWMRYGVVYNTGGADQLAKLLATESFSYLVVVLRPDLE